MVVGRLRSEICCWKNDAQNVVWARGKIGDAIDGDEVVGALPRLRERSVIFRVFEKLRLGFRGTCRKKEGLFVKVVMQNGTMESWGCFLLDEKSNQKSRARLRAATNKYNWTEAKERAKIVGISDH